MPLPDRLLLGVGTGAGDAAAGNHTHSGAYVPVPAVAPTVGQILSATDDDPLTTDWIDAAAGGSVVTPGRPKASGGETAWSVPGVSLMSVSTQTMSANRANYYPFLVDAAITIDRLAIEVTTFVALCNIRVAIYTADVDYQPVALVVDSGDLDATTNGIKTATINTPLAAGRYVLWTNSSTGNPVLRCLKSNSRSGVLAALGPSPFIGQMYVAQTYAAPPATPLAWTTTAGDSAGTVYTAFVRRSA